MQLKPEEARKWLQEHNFIELPPGSYFHYIEEDWFHKYKEFLSFKNNAWIPRSDKLKELELLDQAYKDYQFRNFREHQPQEQALEIPKTETPKEDTYKNAQGEPLPF